jgi:acyl dehydratase
MSAAAAVGDALGPWVVDPVSAEAMRGLAGLLDDPNPIHLDAAAAAALGLGDRQVNQGPANCAYIVAMLQEAFGGAELRRLRFRFRTPVRAGDKVVAGGRVTGRETTGAGVTLQCETWLDVEGGPRAVTGSATVVLAAGGAAAG